MRELHPSDQILIIMIMMMGMGRASVWRMIAGQLLAQAGFPFSPEQQAEAQSSLRRQEEPRPDPVIIASVRNSVIITIIMGDMFMSLEEEGLMNIYA